MKEQLLIVFVKNAIPGKTKTRLAKTIGNENALKVYRKLLTITEDVIDTVNSDIQVHYSQDVEAEGWQNAKKMIQNGDDLGDRMSNAFQQGFDQGYKKILLIGSDCPEISKEIIESAFEALKTDTVVFGSAFDGGYYLIGQSQYTNSVFQSKSWSQPELLDETISELESLRISYSLLDIQLNDIDTFDDLRQSQLLTQDEEIIGIINKHIK